MALQAIDLKHIMYPKPHKTRLYAHYRAGSVFQSVVLQLGRLTALGVLDVDFDHSLFRFEETDLAKCTLPPSPGRSLPVSSYLFEDAS